MSQRTLGRIFVLVTLTLALTLAGPARAAAAPQHIGPASLWGWLENVWQEGIGILAGPDLSAHLQTRAKSPDLAKEGGCLDPNGCPHTTTVLPGGGK
jgi:hypothetical protein